MTLAALIGMAGFAIGWGLGVHHLGWRVGLLFGWWPALMLGAGLAWVVGIGAPELSALVTRLAGRLRRRSA